MSLLVLFSSSSGLRKTIEFKDDFNDGITSPLIWDNWGGANVVESGGQLNISTDVTSGYKGRQTIEGFDFENSEVSIKVVSVGNQSLATYEAYPIEIWVDTDNRIQFLITAGILYARYVVAGLGTLTPIAPYSSTTHKFLRLRESGGTTYWECSTDRQSWTAVFSIATPVTTSPVYLSMLAGTYASEGVVSTMILDDLNIANSTFTVDGVIIAGDRATFTVDAKIIDAGTRYKLNGNTIARPKTFKRTPLLLHTDMITLSGRTGRDIAHVKEQFVLGWDVLSKDELQILLALVDLAVPITFSVQDKDLTIEQTTVIPNITDITYEVLGSNYIAKLEMVLTEVE